jgi:hypothetical protein
MYFVRIWEQTATMSLHSINWLVFKTETACVYCAVRSAPHSVFMCFVSMSEQTAIISLYSINWLVFSRVRKIARSDYKLHFCPAIRPSVRLEQLGSHWTDDHEIWHLSIFGKSVEKNSTLIKIRLTLILLTSRKVIKQTLLPSYFPRRKFYLVPKVKNFVPKVAHSTSAQRKTTQHYEERRING